MATLKEKLGAYLIDLLPLMHNLSSRHGWVKTVNRNNAFTEKQNPLRIRINERWTSNLAINRSLPWAGKWLMNHSLKDWPITLNNNPVFSSQPKVSFVIPFRGLKRLDLLQAVLKSIAASKNIEVECLVIEQDQESIIKDLPSTVKHIHAPAPDGNPAWNKAYAFNLGVGHAKSDIVICHDADILVPEDYAAHIYNRITQENLEVIYPQRFLYYLTETDSKLLLKSQNINAIHPESIKQNWVGGTLAITKKAYVKIGGFNESFQGWSGEDNDFYDRAQTLYGDFFGYIPFIHLWHPGQIEKVDEKERAASIASSERILSKPVNQRVTEMNIAIHKAHHWTNYFS